MAVRPTNGSCTFAMAMQIERGSYGTVQLDGLGFIVLGSGLIGSFLGVESAPIRFERNGVKWSVNASKLVDMAAEGNMGINPNATEPMYLDNTGHPASDRLALAHASKSHVHALGLKWDDTSGKNNGHYAPFAWKSA